MLTYSEKERMCERRFEEEGPFWHIYTDGNKMADIFCGDEDMKIAVIILAVATCLTSDAELVTFEIMNNHLHLIARGQKERCLCLFETFKQKIIRLFRLAGKVIDWKGFEANILEIESLRALRNEIIYVHRNAFVANPQYTPFSYPWGGGCAYFTPFYKMLQTTGYEDVGFNRWRQITHCRDIEAVKKLKFIGNAVFIPSFCRTDIGEAMFHDARSYFNSLTRNAEAFSQIASRLKDSIFMTDEEQYAVAVRFADQQFGNKQLALLNPDQKIQLAKELHFKYNASNQQLRRILKLELSLLNELFP